MPLDRRPAMTRAKPVPDYPFVIEQLQELIDAVRIRTKPMFGCRAVYVDEKIFFILRRKQDRNTLRDDGMWIALAPQQNGTALLRDMPSLRPIEMFQKEGRQVAFDAWLCLPEHEEGFEEGALLACELVAREDPRIGKIPKPKRKRPAPVETTSASRRKTKRKT